jgi:alpha-mannosidase
MMRPQEQEKSLPGSLFWWQSPDGSRVLTFRIPINYASWWGEEDPVRAKALDVAAMAKEQGTDFMCFYGVGNHGGGPTRNSIRAILGLQKEQQEAAFPFSTPETYFREVLSQGRDLPVVEGELQHHARGCYSAHSEVKALNRKAEHRLLAAEKLASIAHRVTGLPYPDASLREAWEKVLFNQFHDAIGGCSVPEAYEDVREFYGQSLTLSAEVLNRSAQAISWAIDTSLPGTAPLSRDKDWLLWEKDNLGSPVVVFNPLSWPVDARVRVNRKVTSVTDESRTPIPMQLVRASRTHEGAHDAFFIGRVPAMGYRLFWVYRDKEQPAAPDAAAEAPAEGILDNGLLRAEIDTRTGFLSRLVDLRSGADVLGGAGAVPIVIDESACDTWAHDVSSFRSETGRFRVTEVLTMDRGPLVARVRVTSRFGDSVLRQDFALYAGSGVLEVDMRLAWHEKQRMLKLAFPANIVRAVATWEIPYGFVERPANGKEEPGQQWIDVTGKGPDGSVRGLALLNTGKYSFDILGSEMRMTVARSPVAADNSGVRDESCEYLDQGIQDFRYALLPHAGDWREAGVVRAAHELNSPPFRVLETYHPGPLASSFEGIRVSAAGVVAVAFKRAEDGGAYILRCHESAGRAAETAIELPALRRSWVASFGPFGIKTFRVPDDPTAPVAETGIVERTEDDRAL